MAISKEEAVKELKAKNIRAEYDRGIVMIYAENGKPTFEETRRLLKEMEYQMSFGYHRGNATWQDKDRKEEKGELEATEALETELSDFLTDDEGQISFSF